MVSDRRSLRVMLPGLSMALLGGVIGSLGVAVVWNEFSIQTLPAFLFWSGFGVLFIITGLMLLREAAGGVIDDGKTLRSIPTGRSVRNYLPTLDGWRTIAIALVLMSHGLGPVPWRGVAPPEGVLGAISRRGIRGVDVFFAISGLLITSRMLTEWHQRGRISLRSFYIRRIFRILPLYFGYLAVLLLLTLFFGPLANSKEFLSCIFFFRNYLPDASMLHIYTAHFWSLAVEEQFYLIWPLVLVLAGRKHGAAAAGLLAILVMIWRPISDRLGGFPFPDALFDHRTDVRFDGLFCGCFAAFLYHSTIWRPRLTALLRPTVWCVLLALAVINEWKVWELQGAARAILFPLLLLGTILHNNWIAGRFLETAVMRWFGRISFGIYVWHALFISESSRLFDSLGVATRFPIALVCAVACAAASYYLFESPMVKVGHRLSRQTADSPGPRPIEASRQHASLVPPGLLPVHTPASVGAASS